MGLIQEFQRADAARRKEVGALAREADAFVRDLHKVSAARTSDVATMIREFEKGDADRRSEVAAMRADADAFVGHLHQVSADRRSEVTAFVGHLHQVSADRRSDVATMIREFEKGDAERRSEVAAMVADADAFVRQLHKLSAARHAEVWGGAAAARRAAPPPRAAAPPPAATVAGETVTLRDVIFTYLADHPDGARLTDMEREFGMARIQLATALRSLIDDNKVEKRELLYFAI